MTLGGSVILMVMFTFVEVSKAVTLDSRPCESLYYVKGQRPPGRQIKISACQCEQRKVGCNGVGNAVMNAATKS